MPMFKDNMSDVQKWGEAIPKGWYHARISHGKEDGVQTSSSGNPVFRVYVKIQEEPFVGRTVRDDISLQSHALAKLKAYYEAVDYNPGPEGHDPDNLWDKELYVYLDQDMYEGTMRNKIPPFGLRHIMKGKPTEAQSSAAASAR